MDTNQNQQPNETVNTTVKPTFVSTVKGLPIALAGEMAKQPAKIAVKFQYADTVMSEDKKTWIRIHVEGLSIPLFRNLSQAKADLSNYIDAGTAEHMGALAFETAFNKHFRNKELYLMASAYDLGSKYIVDENSTAYKKELAQIGDELEATSAGVRIDGFIRALLSEAENDAVYEEQLRLAREKASQLTSGNVFAIS